MPLVKFSNYVRAHADKAFLAHCTRKGDTCRCHYDNPLKSIHSKEQQSMPTIFDTMTAADRKALANKILELPEHERRDLVSQLSGVIDKLSAAEAESTRKSAFAEKLSAMKADKNVGAGNAIGLIEGNLRRYNLPPLADLGIKPLHEINTLMAAAKLPTNDRMAIKSVLHRLGAID
jgi:hypothetical protein